MKTLIRFTCLAVVTAWLTYVVLKTPNPVATSTKAYSMPVEFKMKPLYEPRSSEDTVPTTETLIWDCPECCDTSSSDTGVCDTTATTLYVSGVVSCTLTAVTPGSWIHAPTGDYCGTPGGCRVSFNVSCYDGILNATVSVENYGPVLPVYVSQNPILITATVPAFAGCAGGVITISE